MAGEWTPGLDRLVQAFEHAGYRIADLEKGEPAEVLLDDLELDRQLDLRIYLWRLGHERFRPRSRRALMARSEPEPLELGPKARTLVLGYASDLDTFVGWQPEVRPEPAQNASIRVPEEQLEEALDTGFGVHVRAPLGPLRTAEIVTAFRPDRVRAYLDAVPDLSRVRAELEEGGLGGGDQARREAFRALSGVGFAAGSGGAGSAGGGAAQSMPESKETKAVPSSAEREVGTGFLAAAGGKPLQRHQSLRPGDRYLFWFKVGEPVEYSIEQTPTDVPLELLPARAELTVALFGFDGELELYPDADLGHLDVDDEGHVRVREAVAEPAAPVAELGECLYFPVSAPAAKGPARLRCNVYCDGVLVQSRLVTAQVAAADAASGDEALVSTLEYALSRSLHPAQLAKLPAADLSLMMNGTGDLHQLRFFAPGDDAKGAFKADSELDAHTVNNLIDYARKGLRVASWGSDKEWSNECSPKHEGAFKEEKFRLDLAKLADRGALTYVGLIEQLAGGDEARERLEEKARYSGRVEIAAAPDRFVPAAMFYDAPIEVGVSLSSLTVCPAFLAAREDPAVALENCACLGGSCPQWDDPLVVCPGGFWGFRHSIGWPISIADGDALGVLAYETSVRTAMASSDELTFATQHREDVEGLLGKLNPAAGKKELLELLGKRSDQIVYLYCHGGETPGGAAYISIGAAKDPKLTIVELDRLRLKGGSSLVFLNGCKTTAVSPSNQFDLVNGFVKHGGALGVIGTEITVFEPMAGPFALDFLRSFVVERATVGTAIRHARLAALKRGNPLGLAYVPFVLGGTTLEPLAA
jgi:hypothetical protein